MLRRIGSRILRESCPKAGQATEFLPESAAAMLPLSYFESNRGSIFVLDQGASMARALPKFHAGGTRALLGAHILTPHVTERARGPAPTLQRPPLLFRRGGGGDECQRFVDEDACGLLP